MHSATSITNPLKVPVEQQSQVINEALKLLKKYVFHPEWYSKDSEIFQSLRKLPTRRKARVYIYLKYTDISTFAEVGISLNHMTS